MVITGVYSQPKAPARPKISSFLIEKEPSALADGSFFVS